MIEIEILQKRLDDIEKLYQELEEKILHIEDDITDLYKKIKNNTESSHCSLLSGITSVNVSSYMPHSFELDQYYNANKNGIARYKKEIYE